MGDKNADPVKFEVTFSSDSAEINAAPEGESWIDSFNWDEFGVDMHTLSGDDVKFTAYEKAPAKIKTLFVREYVKDYYSNYLPQ